MDRSIQPRHTSVEAVAELGPVIKANVEKIAEFADAYVAKEKAYGNSFTLPVKKGDYSFCYSKNPSAIFLTVDGTTGTILTIGIEAMQNRKRLPDAVGGASSSSKDTIHTQITLVYFTEESTSRHLFGAMVSKEAIPESGLSEEVAQVVAQSVDAFFNAQKLVS